MKYADKLIVRCDFSLVLWLYKRSWRIRVTNLSTFFMVASLARKQSFDFTSALGVNLKHKDKIDM